MSNTENEMLQWKQTAHGKCWEAQTESGYFKIVFEPRTGFYSASNRGDDLAINIPSLELAKNFCVKYEEIYNWLDAEIEKASKP